MFSALVIPRAVHYPDPLRHTESRLHGLDDLVHVDRRTDRKGKWTGGPVPDKVLGKLQKGKGAHRKGSTRT